MDSNLYSLLTPHFVIIHVGPQRKNFHIHRDVLIDRSAFFKAALLGNFLEAQTQELSFPEDDEEAFTQLVKWIYTTNPPHRPQDEPGLLSCLALFTLAEKYLQEYLCNLCSDLVRAYYRDPSKMVSPSVISYAYSNIQRGLLQNFLCRVAAVQSRHLKSSSVFRELLMESGTFAADFAYFLIDDTVSITSYCGRALNCSFHKHDCTPVCKGLTGKYRTAEEIELSFKDPRTSPRQSPERHMIDQHSNNRETLHECYSI